MKDNQGWIGVDLDGTLARYNGNEGPYDIGEPLEPMARRVRDWLGQEIEVRIVTARVDGGCTESAHLEGKAKAWSDVAGITKAIQDWTEKHFGQRLRVTASKDYEMRELWDDRAVRVVRNTGEAAIVPTDPDVEAMQLVLKERTSQVEEHGFTANWDDKYPDQTLSLAAACYVAPVEFVHAGRGPVTDPSQVLRWPFGPEFFRRTDDVVSNLTKAAALLIADIGRILRAQQRYRQLAREQVALHAAKAWQPVLLQWATLTQLQRTAVEMAAGGRMSGTLSEWPELSEALRILGFPLAPSAAAVGVCFVCQAIMLHVEKSTLKKEPEMPTDAEIDQLCGPDLDQAVVKYILTAIVNFPQGREPQRPGELQPALCATPFHSSMRDAVRLAERVGVEVSVSSNDQTELATLVTRDVLKAWFRRLGEIKKRNGGAS